MATVMSGSPDPFQPVPGDPFHDLDLAAFASRLRSGAFTAEQATRAYLQRIAAADARLGAFRAVDEAAALREAQCIDRLRLAGEDLGPLMGLPVAIKELFRVDGLPFGAGSDVDIRDLEPAQGPFVDSLKRSGCIVLGVTGTTEFAASTINSGKPAPWNPWDATTKRVCGGSSHGSAAALAAGLCAFSVGSDTGGSVRLPAALCGIVGLKPSMGIWSTEGVFPLAPTFDTVGVFTRSAADATLVFETLAKRRVPAPPPASGLRIGRVANLFHDLDRPVAAAIERSLQRLSDAGVDIVDIELPEVSELGPVFGRILAGELVHYLGRERLLANKERIDPVPWARIETELDIDLATLERLRRRQRELTEAVARRIDGFDVIACATTPISPGPAAEVVDPAAAIEWNRRSGSHTRPGNLFGLCGISLPVHAAGELPVGLLLQRNGDDEHLLAVAQAIEAIVGRAPSADLAPFFKYRAKESAQ
jgi:aspartyl-tRNA(Asn)/glutamyl-tRNA(Gln) amidotransferase subunit A